MSQSLLRTCAKPESLHMSHSSRAIQPSTGAPPGTRATPCPPDTANGSKKYSAWQRPSAEPRRPHTVASSLCGRASS